MGSSYVAKGGEESWHASGVVVTAHGVACRTTDEPDPAAVVQVVRQHIHPESVVADLTRASFMPYKEKSYRAVMKPLLS